VADEGVFIPDGYVRDPDGRWRYVDDGEYVPGARDVTLGSLWRFRVEGEHVLVRTSAILADATLSWCRSWADGVQYVPGRRGRHGHEVTLVDREEWEIRRRDVVGVSAPELALNRLIGVRDVARIMGVEESTVRAYLARGYLPKSARPEPLGVAWSLPVILKRLEQRSGQGRKQQRTRAASGTTSVRLWSFEDEDIEAETAAEVRDPGGRDTEFDEWMKHIDRLRKK
jgi:hypothetical protein